MVLKLSNLFDKNKKGHVEDIEFGMDVLAPERRPDGSLALPENSGIHPPESAGTEDHTVLHNPADDQDDLRRYAFQNRLDHNMMPVPDGSLNEQNGSFQSFPDIEVPDASTASTVQDETVVDAEADLNPPTEFYPNLEQLPPDAELLAHEHAQQQEHAYGQAQIHDHDEGNGHGLKPEAEPESVQDHQYDGAVEEHAFADPDDAAHYDDELAVLEKSAAQREEDHARMTALREQVEAAPYALPLIGRLEIQKQTKILFWTALFTLILTIVFLWLNSLSVSQISLRTQLAGDALMYSQRLAKAAPNAMNGNEQAFDQLYDSRKNLSNDLLILSDGGSYQDNLVRPATGEAAQQLKKARALWSNSDNAASTINSQKALLTTFGGTLRQMKDLTPELLELTEQVADAKSSAGATTQEVEATSELTMLTQRLSRSAAEFQSVDGVYPELAFQLRKDASTFRAIVEGMLNGNTQLGLVATKQDDIRKILFSLHDTFDRYEGSVNRILGSVQNFSSARQSEQLIFNESEALRTDLSDLQNIFREQGDRLTLQFWLMIAFAVVTVMLASAIAYITISDGRRRAMEAQLRSYESEEQRFFAQHMEQEAMRTNDQTQAAILRLMNELQEVADGDLTVQATVSEDITGAIADSVNYTVEELRGLVGRVTSTATQVNNASSQAQTTSIELLAAAHKQSRDIQDTSRAVVDMATQITEVSRSASESADVARQSVGAAQQGMLAVQNAIAGMNGIREQIQETSKRIKRLGESSQEIGEIIELISDITEQTNVLALNAAIQAASAGDAGRGFSVVAEEVQRLAERSGSATKQIGALVRTIQTDTQAAVIAMEKSTAGVVDGARLSDAAGAALTDIGTISNRLADLIETISANTQEQADSATEVASNMQNILEVTEQTREGTRQTALSIRELSKLAEDLRSSVSRFRIAHH